MAATRNSILNNRLETFDGFPHAKAFRTFYSTFNMLINPSRTDTIKNSLGLNTSITKIVLKYDRSKMPLPISGSFMVRYYNNLI